MSTTVDTASTGSASGTKSSADFDKWYDKTKTKLLDLNVSDDELIKFISKEFSNVKGSAEKRNALQQLSSLRTEVATALSNVLRTLSETSRYIINNLRS